MVRLIVISILVLAEILYNRFCPPFIIQVDPPGVGLTNVSVLFFSVTYLAYLILCIEGFIVERSTILKIFFIAYEIFFIIFIVIELCSFGLPYSEYISNVSNKTTNLITHIFLFTILVSCIITCGYKYFKKRKICHERVLKI